jgi:AcrR family transcriptional regulator
MSTDAVRDTDDRTEARGTEASTRARIQQVALDLFAEKGYEATSLREIAEQLGVTKAALYYHFKTKDEIVESLAEDWISQVRELVAWGKAQPHGLETAHEVLRRYSTILYQPQAQRLVRFAERNQSSLGKHPGARLRDEMLSLHQVLVGPNAPLIDQIRSTVAVISLHAVFFNSPRFDGGENERREAGLTVALELLDAAYPHAQR